MTRAGLVVAFCAGTCAAIRRGLPRFDSSLTNRQFTRLAHEASPTGVIAVASFPGTGGCEGLSMSNVDGTSSILHIDCSNAAWASRDMRIAVCLSSVLLCDARRKDMNEDRMLQVSMEYNLNTPPGTKKQLHLLCAEGSATEEEGRCVDLVWDETMVKIFGEEAAGLSNYFDVIESFVPHSPALSPRVLQKAAEKSGVSIPREVLEETLAGVATRALPPRPAPARRGSSQDFSKCDAHLGAALAEFQGTLSDLKSELMGADVETFGGICNEAVDQVLGTFDALASESSDATRQAKREELLRHVLRHLETLYRDHLRHLETLAWDHMREGLAKLRLGDPSLLEDMESVVRDADIFFRKISVKMVCKGASWTSNFERSRLITKMRAFVKERLLAARLQGAFVPGMLRRPVAISMHYLASHPFRVLDAIQDSLSYEEDMEWAPDFGISGSNGRSGTLGQMKDVVSASGRMSRRAEL